MSCLLASTFSCSLDECGGKGVQPAEWIHNVPCIIICTVDIRVGRISVCLRATRYNDIISHPLLRAEQSLSRQHVGIQFDTRSPKPVAEMCMVLHLSGCFSRMPQCFSSATLTRSEALY